MADVDLPPGVDPPADTFMASEDAKAADEGSEQNSQRSNEEPKKKNLYADEYDLDADNPLAGSDDEEDGIQVTIGKIEPVVSFSMKHATHERQHTSKLDLDSLPRIGDTPIYDVDLASMDDRPWRKPGADITDYFNYGFTEETWNTYCERQKKLRSEFTSQAAVNKALFSNIYLANPLGMPVMGSRNISTIGDGPSTVKVLTDNGGRFKAHHHGMNSEPVVRTVIGAPSNVSGPPGVGTPTTGPPMDFSKPPPGMNLPPPTVPVLGVPPGMSDGVPGMDGPPGVVGPPGLDGPPGIDVSSSIPTVGSGAALDMSLPPPGFNPSLPPPGMSVRPPPIGLPMNIGSAGFNSVLPPPAFSQVRYPMGSGGVMGRPPPLMGRDFGRDGDMDDDRRTRRRSRSRSPRRSDRDRRRDDDRRDRDRKDRDRERSERSSRRHRSRSREDRDKRRDRKDDDSDRKRKRHDRDDDDDRRERRRRRDEGRSPDRNTPERGGSHDEEAVE